MDNEVRTRILTMRNMTSLTANYSDDARKSNGTDNFVLFILTSKYILLHRQFVLKRPTTFPRFSLRSVAYIILWANRL